MNFEIGDRLTAHANHNDATGTRAFTKGKSYKVVKENIFGLPILINDSGDLHTVGDGSDGMWDKIFNNNYNAYDHAMDIV